MKANNQSFELILWIKKKENQETFALAWINGYEVKKEKRYFVRVKGVYFNNCLIFEKRETKRGFSLRSMKRIIKEKTTLRKSFEEAGFEKYSTVHCLKLRRWRYNAKLGRRIS